MSESTVLKLKRVKNKIKTKTVLRGGKIQVVTLPDGHISKKRSQYSSASFADIKEGEQKETMYGYDKVGKIWMPRRDMLSINVIANEKASNKESKIPMRVGSESFDEVMEFLEDMNTHTISIKAFDENGECKEFCINVNEELYDEFMSYFKKYRWDNDLRKEEDIPPFDDIIDYEEDSEYYDDE